MLPAKTALNISAAFAMVFFLAFLYNPFGALTRYEIYKPPVQIGKKPPAQPTAAELTALSYFTVLLALGMFSLAATWSAVARLGHQNSMKLSCAVGCIGRVVLLLFLLNNLTGPLKLQMVASGAILVVQALGATTGGMPSMPTVAMPASSSGKACLLCASLALLQMTAIALTGPVEYMAKNGLVVTHPQAKEAFATLANMFCIVMSSAAMSRIIAVLAGDKDTIYAVHRSSIFYYGMMVGVFAMFKAAMAALLPELATETGTSVQLIVLIAYFILSVTALVSDDEAGYTKDKTKTH